MIETYVHFSPNFKDEKVIFFRMNFSHSGNEGDSRLIELDVDVGAYIPEVDSVSELEKLALERVKVIFKEIIESLP